MPRPHTHDPGLSWLSPMWSCRRFREPMSQERGVQERPESREEDDRKVRRREKNRVAAQRSRKKQTQKADKLHEEYESLEQENTSLKREIGKLTDEMKHLSEVLKDHEKICPLLHCTMNFVTIPRPDALASCLPR
ncbi:basic leucine zipper transcriptional factor ATF-like 3 isoform X1 [Haemorhous mexicanus]|uniref:basic leucine zipper transcriptional factor ATF-like 3 isoform X1 n=1 Tax=Haemorhous mexicanus TaxID=30427 RepID=UPI0028BE23D8|nr:basic leucine zipper transcriptional factor ATF-like 3 isoform X1 [Haemorhous mexicanus]